MSEWQAITNILFCLLAFALIFWGLRLFQIYLIVVGAVLGGLLGSSLADAIFQAKEAVIIGGVFLAIVGGVAAWPLQKAFIFLMSGSLAGFLGLIIAHAIGFPDKIWISIGIVLFIAGGVTAAVFYEYFILLTMAFAGALIVFNIIYFPDIRLFAASPPHLWRELLRLCKAHIVAFLYVSMVFVLFSVYFQKVSQIKETDLHDDKNQKTLFTRVGYAYACIALCGYIVSTLVLGHPFYGGIIITGINLVSWPVLVFLTSVFLIRLNRRQYELQITDHPAWNRILLIFLFGITVIPAVTWLIWSGINIRIFPMWFFKAFFDAPTAVLAAKWVFSLFVFPVLTHFYLAKPKFVSRDP